MKNKFSVFFYWLGLGVTISSCSLVGFEKTTTYLNNTTPTTGIVFNVPKEALPAVASDVQLQLVQPNVNLLRGNFPLAGTAAITVNFVGVDPTSLRVNLYRTFNNAAAGQPTNTVEQRIEVGNITSFSANTAVFTAPMSTLAFPPPVAAPTANSTVTLEFVATDAQGKRTVRFFTLGRLA